jgi:CRISPR-associated protein (TIGR03984 family)
MSQTRQLVSTKYAMTKSEVAEPVMALQQAAASGRYTYLLAHADDGVIWGRVQNGQLITSDGAFPAVSPPLRAVTLQQARLFSPTGEMLIWRTDAGWRLREIADGAGESAEAFDEDVILWGTNDGDQPENNGFWLAVESDLGMQHAPPLNLNKRHTLKLRLRHYLDFDTDHDGEGAAFVKVSRLVDVMNGGEA